MPVQNHIHLATTVDDTGELAPPIKWKVKIDGWLPVPNIIQETRVTLSGKRIKHRLRLDDGSIPHLQDHKYILRISDYWDMTRDERLDALLDMQGEVVYLVDNLHCADAVDHTPYIRRMYLNLIPDIKNINAQLDPLYISIDLLDDTL